MQAYFLLLLLGVLTIISRNICNGDVTAIKCCAPGEHLNHNLTLCQKLNATSTAKNQSYISTLANTTLNSMHSTSAESGDADFEEFAWIPEPLSVYLGGNDILLYEGQNNCDASRTVRLQYPRDAHRVKWLSNGSLVLRSPTPLNNSKIHVFDPEDFCTDSFADNNGTEQHAILLCPCHRIPCVKKCCLLGEAMVCDDFTCECRSHETDWIPFFQDLPLEAEDFPFEIVTDFNLSCADGYQDLVYVTDTYPQFLLHRFWEEMLTDGQVCGEIVVGLPDTPRQGMMKCSPEIPFPKVYVLVNWLHVPEGVLLAAALLGALAVPRRRQSAHARTHDLALTCHAAALLARCALWAAYLRDKWSCGLLPIFIYFFSIAASFWLNVLCLNMACGFWKPLGVQGRRWGRAGAMLLLYSAYAWGCAGALTAFTAAMWLSRRVPRGLLRPTLHETRTCFREEESDGKLATFAYYYGPVGGLLCVNALLFAATALRVRQLRDSAAILKTADGKHAFSNKRSVVIYIKLLWLMGVMEMTVEAVAWISNSNEYYFALAASCLDMLRAVAIFILCCCKRRTIVALRDFSLRACGTRWPPRPCCPGRRAEERDLSGTRNGNGGSDTSMATEVTDSDAVVCECGM